MENEAPETPNPVIPPVEAEEGDLGLESAEDLLRLTDKQMKVAFKLGGPPEGEAEDPDEAIATAVAEKEEKPQVELQPKPKAPVKAAAPPVETPTEETPPETPPEKPETPPEKPPEPEPPKRVAEYTAHDKDGELEIPPDVTLTFKADGKVRENVPLDLVVRMAQTGIYNHGREQQLQQREQAVQQTKQETDQLKDTLKQYDAWFQRVLRGDEDSNAFLQTARQKHAEQNSPEARVARAEARVQEMESRQSQEEEARSAAAYLQTELAPRLTQLIEEHPSIPFEEMMGRFNLITAPYLVRGQLPLPSLPMVKQLIEAELAPWARSVHDTRELDKKRVNNKVDAARTETTLAKRKLARAQQPGPVATAPAPPKARPEESADEWLERTLPLPKVPA